MNLGPKTSWKKMFKRNTSIISVHIGITFNQIVLTNGPRKFYTDLKICIKLARVIWLTGEHHWNMLDWPWLNISIITSLIWSRSYFRRIYANVLHFILCYDSFVSRHINSHIWRSDRIQVVTNVPQPRCMAIFNKLINSHILVLFTPRIFLCSPNFNLFS